MERKAARLLCLFVALILVAVFVPVLASAEDSEQTFKVHVRGINSTFYYGDVTMTESGDVTAQDLFMFMNESVEGLTITGADTGYITKVNSDGSALTTTGWDGWMFRVNGVSPSVGIGDCYIESGAEVVLYYSDEFVTGMQYPKMDVSQLKADYTLIFTSQDTVYDENWQPMVVTNPVVGMTVTVGTFEYVTDDEGKIQLSKEQIAKDAATVVSVSVKKDTKGIPTVLRLDPETTIFVPLYTTNPATGDHTFMWISALTVLAVLGVGAVLISARKSHKA